METIFIYKGQKISTPNLEKKLKRMKITLDDIEIIKEEPKQEIKYIEEDDLETVYVKSTKDDLTRITVVLKGTRPPLKELFKSHIWNPETKTGIRNMTEEFIETMYYEN